MPRDTYHDYVTDRDICDDTSGLSGGLARTVYLILRGRSGAHNVRNAVFRRYYDPSVRATQFAVSFDSRAWTGRY